MAKKTIAIFTTTQGHKSLAEAVQQHLSEIYDFKVFYEVDDLFYSYYIFYKYAPFLFVTPYVVGTNPAILEMARLWMQRRYYQKIVDFIAKTKPVALINTFWMYEGSLEKIARAQNLPLLNIIADPLTFHPTSVGNPPAVNLLFDNATEARLRKFSKKALSQITGWLVRPQFVPAPDKNALRQRLKLQPHRPVVLVVTGSDGIENLLELLEHLQTSAAADVIVACGHNKALHTKVLTMIPKIKTVCPELQIIVLPFTDKIHEYMQAADLVVGKAGPNMVFEAAATLTPFLATTHIAGQEDGNIEIIKRYNLGWVDEEPRSAALLLQRLIENPDELSKLQPDLQKMAAINRQAPSKVAALLQQALET